MPKSLLSRKRTKTKTFLIKKNLLKKILALTGNLDVRYLNTYLAEEKRESYVVDIQAFRESSLGDLKFMISLMENVIDQTEESMILINKLVLDDDHESLKKVIHKIKPIIVLIVVPESAIAKVFTDVLTHLFVTIDNVSFEAVGRP